MGTPKDVIKNARPENNPSSPERRGPNRSEHDRTAPGRKNPEYERTHSRTVNEDEQLKAVNNREDNAQSINDNTRTENNVVDTSTLHDNHGENESPEAGDDQSEMNTRPPKVN